MTVESETVRVHEVVPDRVFRVSALLPLDGTISWAAEDPDRVETVNCYVLRGPAGHLLIDTGVRIHGSRTIRAVKQIVGDGAVEIAITRTEPDTIGNIFRAVTELGVRKLTIFGNHVHPVDFSNAIEGGPEVVARGDLVVSREPFVGTHEFLGIPIESIAAPMRVLATAWLYSPRDKVLFVSDAFGYLKLASFADDPVHTSVLDGSDASAVERYESNVFAKFGWLAHCRTEPFLDGIDEVIAERDVKIFAPTHGKVLRGKDVIRSCIEGLRRLPHSFELA